MRLWPRRTRSAPSPTPRSNPTRIAILEHDLLGIKPQPGTAAALTVAFRKLNPCVEHQPIETTTLSDPRPNGMCQRCGCILLQDEHGDWVVAKSPSADEATPQDAPGGSA